MPDLISDPSLTVYAIVGIMVAVLAGIYLRSRKRKDLFPLLGGAAVLLALFLIDRFVESPREESIRKMEEMSAFSAQKKWDDVFGNISDSFSYRGVNGSQTDKKGFRNKVRSVEPMIEKGFVVWDFTRDDFRQISDTAAEIGFRAQIKDRPESVHYVKAQFTRDPDGQWRMSGFTCFDPVNTKDRRNIPGLD